MQEKKSKDERAFFALLRAGLWEQPVSLAPFAPLDFDALFRLAKEQSVIGLIAAGFEQVSDIELDEDDVVPFMHKVLHQESRNEAMDAFVARIVTQLSDAGIQVVLVKGQGVAQCYVRPLWRSSGDVDLFFNEDEYEKAKAFLLPLSVSSEEENTVVKHLGIIIDSWLVELHGTLHCNLSEKMDRMIDSVQKDTFKNGGVRVWKNDGTDVYLPSADNDVIFIFTHYLKHFFKGGIGLRQIADWCRLIYTYYDAIDECLLQERLAAMGMLSEWKAFAAYAVDNLGMPKCFMPLYDCSAKWSRKARRISSFIMEVGNFGHNRDVSYYDKYPFLVRKTISFWRRTADAFLYLMIFPLDSVRFYVRTLFNGFSLAAKGVG